MHKYRFFLFSLVVLLLAGAFAQGQPKARKFDELTMGIGAETPACSAEYDEQQKQMRARLRRYAKQLTLENAKAYIIGYGPRVKVWEIYDRSYGHMRASQASSSLSEFFDYKRIVTIDGGAREKAVTELWIVPRGATPPSPTRSAKPEDVSECPFLRVLSPGYVPRPDAPFQIRAAIESNQKQTRPTFAWRLSSGKIVAGQGTDTITVEVPADMIGKVFAKVDVSGYSFECPNHSTSGTSTTIVGVSNFLFETFGSICWEDEQARVDNFTIFVQENPELNAYVVVYDGRCYSSCGSDYPLRRPHYPRRGYAELRAKRIKDYMNLSRGVSPDRVTTLNGGYRESFEVELWLAPRGAPPPPLTPTVAPQDITYKTGRISKRELAASCLPQK
ncbi:MAG TPA: hypothetical protein VGW58_15320 [Pyrinomonadaceae bacterium]|nr:hypothetical protein [Pyrinomonadaceae bacterium]